MLDSNRVTQMFTGDSSGPTGAASRPPGAVLSLSAKLAADQERRTQGLLREREDLQVRYERDASAESCFDFGAVQRCPEDACPRFFCSWFFNWIPKVQRCFHGFPIGVRRCKGTIPL